MTSDSPVVTQALAYADRGWPVFPVKITPKADEPGKFDKTPLTEHGHNDASTDPDVIRKMRGWRKRSAGIGVVTGKRSGLIIIDLDVHTPGVDGPANWANLLKDRNIDLPDTLRSQTITGGQHLWFLIPEGAEYGDSPGTVAQGVDVKAGGYVVAPGTEGYSWLNDFNTPLAKMPGGIVTEKPVRPASTEPRLPVTVDQAVTGFAAGLARIITESEGTRHNVLMAEAENAAEFVQDGLLDKEWVDFELSHVALDSGLDPKETASEIAYAFAKFPPRQVNNLLSGPWDYETMWADDLIWADDNLGEPIWGPPESPLWKPGRSLLIAGESGLGKSTLALSLIAAQIGLLPDVLGWPVRDDGGRVLYLALDRPAMTREMLWRLVPRDDSHKRQILRDRLILKEGPLPKDILKEKNQDWLPKQVRALGATRVVIDALEDVILNCNDVGLAGRYNLVRQTLVTAGIDLTEVHHTRKADLTGHGGEGNANDVYGAAVLRNGAGSMLTLSRKKDAPDDSTEVYLRQVKSLSGTMAKMTLTRDEKAGVFRRSVETESLEEKISGLFILCPDGPVRLKSSEVYPHVYPEGSTTGQQGNIRKMLSKLVKVGELVRDRKGYYSQA